MLKRCYFLKNRCKVYDSAVFSPEPLEVVDITAADKTKVSKIPE